MAQEQEAESDLTIESLLAENRKFPPSEEFRTKAHLKSMEEYEELYRRSVEEPEKFWEEMAEELYWFRKWEKVLSYFC